MNHIAEGFTAVTPYLIVENAQKTIDFCKAVLGATERFRMDGPGGSIMHAEIEIEGAVIMLGDANEEWGTKAPKALGGSPASLMVYVPDVDATMAMALENGATEKSPIQDMFWGDRMWQFNDPDGHNWTVATHVEDVSPDEIAKRQAAYMEQAAGG